MKAIAVAVLSKMELRVTCAVLSPLRHCRTALPHPQIQTDIPPYVQRTVELNRPEGTGLGFNIIGGEGDTGIFISYISPGSISDKSEKLVPGDLIVEVRVYACV